MDAAAISRYAAAHRRDAERRVRAQEAAAAEASRKLPALAAMLRDEFGARRV